MRKAMKLRIVFAHLLMAALILVVALVPNHRRNVADPTAFFVAIGIIEVLYLVALVHGRKQDPFPQGSTDITLCVWVLLLLWEIFGPVLGIAHNVLLPSPENVFNVFVDHGGELALSVVSSLELLLSGFFFGTLFGVILGVICGWIPRLRAMFYPIANVFAPIPSVVFTPFLVILMPSYRLAAVMVILEHDLARWLAATCNHRQHTRAQGEQPDHDYEDHHAIHFAGHLEGPAHLAYDWLPHAYVRGELRRQIGHWVLDFQCERVRKLCEYLRWYYCLRYHRHRFKLRLRVVAEALYQVALVRPLSRTSR